MAGRVVNCRQFWSIFPGCRSVKYYWTTALCVILQSVLFNTWSVVVTNSGTELHRYSKTTVCNQNSCKAGNVMWCCVCQLSAHCDKKVQHFVRKLVTVVRSIDGAQNFCPYTSSWFNESSSGTDICISILSSSKNYIRCSNKSISYILKVSDDGV